MVALAFRDFLQVIITNNFFGLNEFISAPGRRLFVPLREIDRQSPIFSSITKTSF